MNQTIENLLKALEAIEEPHYKTNQVRLVDGDLNIHKDEFSTYENNFVSKLNEKYFGLNHVGIIEEPIELIRQCQIPKRLIYSEDVDYNLQEHLSKILTFYNEPDFDTELQLIPDFIIHKDEKDKESENQRLIVEVKTESTLSFKKFVWDFFKLNIYIDKLNFQNGAFLSVNMTVEKITEYVNRYVEKGFYITDKPDNLYIILKENYESNPVILKLKTLKST